MKFKIGDIINSSLSSSQEVIDIRVSTAEDEMANRLDFVGQLCYVLQYVGGKKSISKFPVKWIDSDHHLKGSEQYEIYQSNWEKAGHL
jgi:hypothetical protein